MDPHFYYCPESTRESMLDRDYDPSTDTTIPELAECPSLKSRLWTNRQPTNDNE